MSPHESWLQARKTGIGGSDVAAILGLSKYKTPLAVYQDKRGEAPPVEDNEAMRWGRYLEPAVRQAYADTTGRQVLIPETMLRHPKHSFMVANLDGFTEDRRVFEAKTARSAADWGEPGTDQVPQAYLFQVQHYMAVTGFEIADIAVLIGGSDFRLYEVPADPELHSLIIEAEAEFWDRVQRADPPEPTSSADALALWGRRAREAAVQASEEVLAAVEHLITFKADRALLDAAEDQCKTAVLKALGECDTLLGPDGKELATWKAQKGAQRFDAAAFKATNPQLYAQFVKAGEPTRRFLLKP